MVYGLGSRYLQVHTADLTVLQMVQETVPYCTYSRPYCTCQDSSVQGVNWLNRKDELRVVRILSFLAKISVSTMMAMVMVCPSRAINRVAVPLPVGAARRARCVQEVLYLQPMIPPKRFDVSPPYEGMLRRSRCVQIFL